MLTTTEASSVTSTSAVSGGNITNAGGGAIIARGVCWGEAINPTTAGSKTTDGTTTGIFTSNITGLSAGKKYYYRAYATNSAGTTYGQEYNFMTPVTDIEGNVYKTVMIGTQVWMAENLKTTKYNDDSAIPNVTVNADWIALTADAYCWAQNDEATYKPLYGALYNWYAVETGKLCPTGWHVPTDAEFSTMEISLGMTQAEADGTEWRGTDQGKTDEKHYRYGLQARLALIPVDLQHSQQVTGHMQLVISRDLGLITYWWTATQYK